MAGLRMTISKPSIADARLYGSNWERNRSGYEVITTGVEGSTQHYAFFRFGDIDIPRYARIISAQFKFWVYNATRDANWYYTVSGVTDNGTLWTETARNGAGRNTAATNSVSIGAPGKWYTASIIAIVEAWRDGLMDPTRGICITRAPDGNATYKQIGKHSHYNPPMLTIVYEVPASIPVPVEVSVALGETVHTDIQASEDGARHVISYKIGDTVLYSEDIGEQVQHTYTVPTSVGAQFPNSLTGTLSIEVTTTVGGEDRGMIAAEVELTLPTDATPTGNCTPSRGGQSLVPAYVQGKSTAIFSVSGAAQYGAAIAGYSLAFEGVTYTAFPATTPMIQGSGHIPYVLTITDSRGLKTQVPGSIPVLALAKPNVVLFTPVRCLINGTPDDDGDYIRVAVSASVSSLFADGAQRNALSYRVYSRPVGTTIWEEAEGAPTPGGISVADDYVLKTGANPKEYNAYQGYDFRVDVSDLFGTTQQLYTIPTNLRQLVLGHDGKSVSFGGPITGTPNAPNAAFHNPAIFYGGAYDADGNEIGAGPGIQHGKEPTKSISGGGSATYTVVFPRAYASAPTVIPIMYCEVALLATLRLGSVSPTGFSAVILSDSSSSKNVGIHWAALGEFA